MKILERKFYKQYSTIELAKVLLGKILVHEVNDEIFAGRIVETEAYLHDDTASHSYNGLSKRNASMFEEAGTAYVYLIYGIYYCFNVVSNEKGKGEAVLIRALEPIINPNSEIINLMNGPGKLCNALKIDKSMDSHKLWEKPLYIAEDNLSDILDENIVTTTRIGITKNAQLPLRFYLKNNKFISRK